MAKKKRRSAKKDKQRKDAQQSRPESKLRRYWQEERWDAFVTYFARRGKEDISAETRGLWDRAVFNLLVQTMFVDRSPAMLPSLLATLEAASPLSTENQACLDLAKLFHKGITTRLTRKELDEIGPDLPEPFETLRRGMVKALDAFQRHVEEMVKQGFPKRATDPGLKHLKSFVQGFEKLYKAGFRPNSVSPYTTWVKCSTSLAQHLTASGANPALGKDMEAMVQASKKMYTQHCKGRDPSPDIIKSLDSISHGDHFRHPAMQNLWNIMFTILNTLYSGQASHQIRVSLMIANPSLLGEDMQRNPRYKAWARTMESWQGYTLKNIAVHDFCKTLLKDDIWLNRERYLLTTILLNNLTRVFFSADPDELEKTGRRLKGINIPALMQEMFDIHARLQPQAPPPPSALHHPGKHAGIHAGLLVA